MAKRRAKMDSQATSPYLAGPPADVDLFYIPPELRQFAQRVDSLVLDPHNVKDHGEADLDAHQASLREFGIRRLVIVRTSNRQVEAGNGTCQAALRNGWEYVPVMFCDDDESRARAFALADNAIATLAEWNPDELRKLTADALSFVGELDLDGLVNSVLTNLGEELAEPEPEQSAAEQPAAGTVPVGEVLVTRRVVVTCTSENQQLKLIAELRGRGFECDVSSRLAK